jgi:lipid II isoglutaminyl synthase (glutamine-hydrolysing)
MADSVITIGLLLPDVLGTYSDAGNAVVLSQRLRWRGITARVLHCDAQTTPPTGCDIYLLGGGEDTAQTYAATWLREHRALCRALQQTATTLAVCAGLQILGHTITDRAGTPHPGAELLDLTTRPGKRRATGEVITRCTIPGIGLLTGFENHLGATTLGPDTTPLGHVLTGVGNGNRQQRHRTEGITTGRIIGTYLHGPVLARNPALADHILTTATGTTLPPLEAPDQAQLRRHYLKGIKD